jgi:hypothetical protein
MSFAASIHSQGYKPPITTESRGGISSEQRWLPGTIVNSAPYQREIDAKLIMDRLLRECLTRKSPGRGFLAPSVFAPGAPV